VKSKFRTHVFIRHLPFRLLFVMSRLLVLKCRLLYISTNMEDMEVFFRTNVVRVLERSHPSATNECRIWDFSRTDNRKYGQTRYKHPITHQWKTINAHRLAYMCHNQILEIPKGHDCSHICHNTLCVNPDHITLELHGINNNRQHCVHLGYCMENHGDLPRCLLPMKPN
jgi:hypothetical protein